MKFWEIFWMISIIFALITFTLLSINVLKNGYAEVKDMLSSLENSDNDVE